MGSKQPPQLQTAKMKKMTVCLTCFRSRFVSSNGRISNMAAPVVPTKLAMVAPIPMKATLVEGRATKSPSMRTPPVMVYKLNSSTINGMYSSSMAFSSTTRAVSKFRPPAVGTENSCER